MVPHCREGSPGIARLDRCGDPVMFGETRMVGGRARRAPDNRVPRHRPAHLVELIEERQQQHVARSLGHCAVEHVVARLVFLPARGLCSAVPAQPDPCHRLAGSVDGGLPRKRGLQCNPRPHHLHWRHLPAEIRQSIGALGRKERPFSYDVGHLSEGRITLKVNGALRQEGDLNQMIWKVQEMISYLSEYFELSAGDVILSGTPAGVAAVKRGDAMEIEVERLGAMTVRVV